MGTPHGGAPAGAAGPAPCDHITAAEEGGPEQRADCEQRGSKPLLIWQENLGLMS